MIKVLASSQLARQRGWSMYVSRTVGPLPDKTCAQPTHTYLASSQLICKYPMHLQIYTTWSAVRAGCKPYHGRGYFAKIIHRSRLFTLATVTIATLASWKQLRLVHHIAGSCGHLAPRTHHPTYTPKTVKYAKCPG